MNLIDCSYFYTGPLQVENACPVSDLDNNAFAVQECINSYIQRYQGEYLTKMVGDALRASIKAYLATQDVEHAEPDPHWEEICSKLRLSFAHYIYYKLAGDANQGLTVTGLMMFKSANNNQSPRRRMARVWNDMVSLHEEFVKWAETSSFEVYYYVEMVTPINPYNL